MQYLGKYISLIFGLVILALYIVYLITEFDKHILTGDENEKKR